MNLIKNQTTKKFLFVAALALLAYVLYINMNGKSEYTLKERSYADISGPAGPSPDADAEKAAGCQMNAGTGLSSSLLPREVAQGEFGEFSPEDILKGQNFLEPRQQIGYPESIGGALRNANQQIRADPPNKKQPYVWNNSTIVPDTMQRDLC